MAGASRGCGRGTAVALAEQSATVYVTGRSIRGGPLPIHRISGTIEYTAAEVTRRGGVGSNADRSQGRKTEQESFDRFRPNRCSHVGPARSSRACPEAMPVLTLPNNWRPRPYQMPLWSALEGGCKRAVAVWHRRAGKDDLALHWTCRQAIQTPGTYWHLLPQSNQARKAVWDAVDPHTGRRRIDWAFPEALRETTREQDMLIRLKSGSTAPDPFACGFPNATNLCRGPALRIVSRRRQRSLSPRARAAEVSRRSCTERGGEFFGTLTEVARPDVAVFNTCQSCPQSNRMQQERDQVRQSSGGL